MGLVGLPHVFVKGKHLGGAEEVWQMNASGKLGEMVHGTDLGFACNRSVKDLELYNTYCISSPKTVAD